MTAAHFEFVDAEIAAAARVIEQGFENPDDALVSAVALVPWMDPGDAPAPPPRRARAAAAAAQEPEDDVESMFGKKKKKKKKMPSRVLRAATPSAAKNEATAAVFRDGLEKPSANS